MFRDREDLAAAIRKAMRMPADEPKVRNLFLNQRVALTAPLISRAEWLGCAGDATIEDREDVYLGLDLSSVNDLTALVMVTVNEPVRVQPFFWKPRDTLIEQSKRDFGAGSYRYMEWADDGRPSACRRARRSTPRSSPCSSASFISATGSGARLRPL